MAHDLDKIARRIASSGRVRTAGKIEFIRDQGPVRRNIRVEGFKWSSDSLRNLAKILWAAQRSHSYAMAAYRMFSRMPSSEFSPDGLLGGLGYIQQVKDMRTGMSQAVEMLSSFTDTVHDEINADHWSGHPDPEVDNIIQDAEAVKANPEGFVQDEFSEDASEGFSNPVPANPTVGDEDEEEPGDEEEEEQSGQSQMASKIAKKKPIQKNPPASQLPDDGGEQKEGRTLSETHMHTVSPDRGSYAASIARILKAHESRLASSKRADSSLPVDTLPGPRVDHIGPAAGNEAGHFNNEDVWPSDDPTGAGLYSGTNESEYMYDGADANGDGVTGYDNPTDGDETSLKVDTMASHLSATYSWLPGSANEKNLNYYDLGLSADDADWMRANNQPDPPPDLYPKAPKPDTDWLWGDAVIR